MVARTVVGLGSVKLEGVIGLAAPSSGFLGAVAGKHPPSLC